MLLFKSWVQPKKNSFFSLRDLISSNKMKSIFALDQVVMLQSVNKEVGDMREKLVWCACVYGSHIKISSMNCCICAAAAMRN